MQAKTFAKIWDNRVRLIIVALMSGLFFFSYFQRASIPGTMFDELQSDFAASAAAIAMLGAIGIYIYGSMQIFTGILADRFGASRVLLAGAAILTAGSILFPLSHSLNILYATRALVGLGASLIWISIVKELDELFDERHFTIVIGVAGSLGYMGGLFGTLPLERAINVFGWRRPLLAVGMLCGLTVVFTWWILHKTKRITIKGGNFSLSSLAEILLNKSAIPLEVASSVTFAVYFLLQATIGKKMLQDCFGLSSAAAASYTFAMSLTNIIGMGSSGFLSRLMGNRRRPLLVGAAAITLLATGFILLILWKNLDRGWIMPCYIAMAAGAAFPTVFFASMKEINRPHLAGTAVGLINGILYLSVAVVMNFAGIVMNMYKTHTTVTAQRVIYPVNAYITIFLGCFVLSLISFVLSLLIKETFGKSIYYQKTEPAKLLEEKIK